MDKNRNSKALLSTFTFVLYGLKESYQCHASESLYIIFVPDIYILKSKGPLRNLDTRMLKDKRTFIIKSHLHSALFTTPS